MTSNRIATTAKLILAAAAITAGAAALAPTAQADTFQHHCTTAPQDYASGAVRGEYSTERSGNDRYEVCKVYAANNKLLGTTYVPNYGYYSPKNVRPGQLPVQARQ